MGSLDDSEVESIWNRLEKYIDVKSLRSSSKEGLKSEIVTALRGINDARVNNLLNSEFADKVAGSKAIKEKLGIKEPEEIIGGGGTPIKEIPRVKTFGVSLKLPPIISVREFGKLGIVVQGRTRIFNGENINVLNSFWKGRKAFYITNSRTGKRVTWGLYK
jgi:hypothetical protein